MFEYFVKSLTFIVFIWCMQIFANSVFALCCLSTALPLSDSAFVEAIEENLKIKLNRTSFVYEEFI